MFRFWRRWRRRPPTPPAVQAFSPAADLGYTVAAPLPAPVWVPHGQAPVTALPPPTLPAPTLPPQVDLARPAQPAAPVVGLVFADGAVVSLPVDDPRARAFRDVVHQLDRR
jgi:hypothetical protein